MKKSYSAVLLIIFSFMLASCKQKVKPFDLGTINNNTYTNTFFNLSLDIPPDWHVQPEEVMDHLNDLGNQMLALEDAQFKSQLEAAQINTANLVLAFEYELGEPVEYNSNFLLVAENLNNHPDVKNGRDYLVHAKQLLKQPQMKVSSHNHSFQQIEIGPHVFYDMHLTIEVQDLIFNQLYYSTILDGFAVTFIGNYNNPEQKQQLNEIFNSLRFN